MRAVLQTDFRLANVMNVYGCNVRSLIAAYEHFTGDVLSPLEIGKIGEAAIAKGLCSANLSVKDPGAIVREAFSFKGLKARCFQIGSQRGEAVTYLRWIDPQAVPEVSFSILKGKTFNKNLHFRLGDANRTLLFDPYPTETVAEEIEAYLFHLVLA